ncbi:MAG: tetratricopeptide repeat protein [Candidatus Obscuribacterales bacterium]|nr:tetratricopeptide repeat protein [Candidatus Obscuribacterales bacterium]
MESGYAGLKLTGLVMLVALAAGLPKPLAYSADLTELEPSAYTQQGIAAFHRGDYPNAIRFLSGRTKTQPVDPKIYYYLGNCYLHTKQHEQAVRMFSTCIKLAPASQAGRYSLAALERMSIMSNQHQEAGHPEPDSQATAASKDALSTLAAIDKSFNDAVVRIKSQRQTLKIRVDRVWEDLQNDLTAMTPRTTTNYAVEMERVRREAEIKVEEMQSKELRFESRLLAPEKIDVRAIPQNPQDKTDDTSTALGSLLDLFKPEKPFDPFGTDIKPELTAKFMTIKDVFGEMSTYQPSARKMAKQVFIQLKSGIENKQNLLDQQIYQLKANLIRDVASIKSNYGNSTSNLQLTPSYHLSASRIPRNNQGNLTQMDADVSQATERAKKRIKELQDSYGRDVDGLIAGAKERIGGMVAQVGQMNKQLQHPSGNIMVVPLGTDVYTRNYVNFGDRPEPQPELKAQAKKMQQNKKQAESK